MPSLTQFFPACLATMMISGLGIFSSLGQAQSSSASGWAKEGLDDTSLEDSASFFSPKAQESQETWESFLLNAASPTSLKTFHETLTLEPHIAGTEGDQNMIEMLVLWFEAMGLEAQKQELELYLPTPIRAEVTITAAKPRDDLPRLDLGSPLPLMEKAVEQDDSTSHPKLGIGWNAYSGDGVAEGEVVYVNYGRKEDFRKLKALGIDLGGKIAIARYGGNYRGFKAKFAQEAGAAGLLIYTDPRDSGFALGPGYPEGGFANSTSIQRGSILTLPYAGDPLTPFAASTPGASHIEPGKVALPKIPVQPIGWGAAEPILARMEGPEVPERWQGALDFPYCLTGGPDLKVRVEVRQKRHFQRTANVFAELKGAIWPDQKIILGCHFDAWGFGATDPHAGSMVLLECARILSLAAQRGMRPARTLVFAHWAAEEAGIIGSTEFCEGYADELAKSGVAYINLDMAAMGPHFRSSAAPLLKSLIVDVTRDVPQARAENRSVYDAWIGSNPGKNPLERIGSLGGGSDHVGFYCHLGIPSCSFGGGGSQGTAYHSNYDTVEWYQKIVGDYEPARMLTQVASLFAARLSGATIIPFSPGAIHHDIARHFDAINRLAKSMKIEFSQEAMNTLQKSLLSLKESNEAYESSLEDLVAKLDQEQLHQLNRSLIALEREWIDDSGIPERPWYRSLYAATDEDSGYAPWMLPALRYWTEHGDQERAELELERVAKVCDSLSRTLRAVLERFR